MLSLVNTALRSFYNPGVLRCTGTMLTRSRAVQTASNTTELDVFHDVNNCEFNINLNGEKAFLKYSLHGNRINLEHTEVPKVFEGKGVARVLAKVHYYLLRFHYIALLCWIILTNLFFHFVLF